MAHMGRIVSRTALIAGQSSLVFTGTLAAAATSGEASWDIVRGVEVNEVVTDTSYTVEKTFPEQVGDGISQFKLTGYVALTVSDTDVSEFILVSDMGFCPYCGDPDHGASLQIKLAGLETTMVDGDRISVMGTLTPVRDSETWQALVLENAFVMR